MSERTLRTALIKLASEHPEFRKDLLPLIKSAAASNGGFDPAEISKTQPGGSAEGAKDLMPRSPGSRGSSPSRSSRSFPRSKRVVSSVTGSPTTDLRRSPRSRPW